jgi:hypothetical protein
VPSAYLHRLEYYNWINVQVQTIRNILFIDWFNSTNNSHVGDHDNPYRTAQGKYQHRFSVNG